MKTQKTQEAEKTPETAEAQEGQETMEAPPAPEVQVTQKSIARQLAEIESSIVQLTHDKQEFALAEQRGDLKAGKRLREVNLELDELYGRRADLEAAQAEEQRLAAELRAEEARDANRGRLVQLTALLDGHMTIAKKTEAAIAKLREAYQEWQENVQAITRYYVQLGGDPYSLKASLLNDETWIREIRGKLFNALPPHALHLYGPDGENMRVQDWGELVEKRVRNIRSFIERHPDASSTSPKAA